MENLKELNLNSNSITSLEENAFNGLGRLEVLILSSNRLNSLENLIFTYLGQLKEIDLSSNYLSSVHADTFGNLGLLERLDLSNNQIREIDPNAFIGSCNIKDVVLDSNPIANAFRFTKDMCSLRPKYFIDLLTIYFNSH